MGVTMIIDNTSTFLNAIIAVQGDVGGQTDDGRAASFEVWISEGESTPGMVMFGTELPTIVENGRTVSEGERGSFALTVEALDSLLEALTAARARLTA